MFSQERSCLTAQKHGTQRGKQPVVGGKTVTQLVMDATQEVKWDDIRCRRDLVCILGLCRACLPRAEMKPISTRVKTPTLLSPTTVCHQSVQCYLVSVHDLIKEDQSLFCISFAAQTSYQHVRNTVETFAQTLKLLMWGCHHRLIKWKSFCSSFLAQWWRPQRAGFMVQK